MQLLELLYENDEAQLAAQLKQVLDKEMEDGKLDESLTAVGLLSWALASNTVLDILGTTKSTAFRDANDCILKLIGNIGLLGPLFTNLSGVTETTKIFPIFFADSKCFICPMCKISNTP